MASGLDNYRRSLRAAVRGYWSRALSTDQFYSTMESTIERRLTQAYYEGAAECGIKPGELTPEEYLELGNAIQSELPYVVNLIALMDELKDQFPTRPKNPPQQVFNRVSLWLNRYEDIRNRAKASACGDQKLIWILGETEEHCSTCPALNGKVKRASFWKKSGIRPQDPPNPSIECGGWGCRCRLELTDLPLSKGPLPTAGLFRLGKELNHGSWNTNIKGTRNGQSNLSCRHAHRG